MRLSELCYQTNLCSSRSDALRVIEQGGIRIGEKVELVDREIVWGDFDDRGEFLLRRGKKKVCVVERV